MDSCHICERITTRDAGSAPAWDNIVRSEHWDLVHSYNSSLLGWLVLVARRHIGSTHELTMGESAELGQLIPAISQALHAELDCVKVYQMQYSEQPGHEHVHMHFVPRAADIADDRKGVFAFGYLGADEASRVPEDQMIEFCARIAAQLGRNLAT